MSENQQRLTIRSYRVCFALERRIHKIERWRIPVPFGIPIRGIAYAVALAIAMLVLGGLPIVGPMVSAISPALRLVALPCSAGYFLYLWEIDGRPAHIALYSAARLHLGPRRLVAFRPLPEVGTEVRLGNVALAPDETSAKLRRGTVRGPASVLFRYPFEAESSGATLRISGEPGPPRWRGKQVTLGDGERMVTR